MNAQTIQVLQCNRLHRNNLKCNGPLELIGEILVCSKCGSKYSIIDNVPVFRDNTPEMENSGFYEEMYAGRSRAKEIDSNYLRNERDFLMRFLKEYPITGPSLEIGCGVGLFAGMAPRYIGLEYSLEALFAEGFEDYDRVCGDATNLPFSSQSMGLIFSFNTLEHVPEVDKAFSEMDRVCKEGGYIILKPAWHCAKYVTELIHILPFNELSFRKKIIRLLLPIIRSKFMKFIHRIPWRVCRRMTAGKSPLFRYRKLIPYQGPLWEADTDAVASLDSHEAILFFIRRGYKCLSHNGILRQILAGHDILVCHKTPQDAERT
jgi:SAM-dependent methyltransferase